MIKLFGKKKKTNGDMSLQITSMADIFMILLVFLLKSYSTSLSNLSPSEGLKLPVATSKDIIRDTLKLEISSTAISVDQKTIVSLVDFAPRASQTDEHGGLPTLFRILQAEREKHPIPNMESNLLVLADQNTPYALLKPVLGAAALAGFVDLQLVAVEAE